jgi:hypothetical protein
MPLVIEDKERNLYMYIYTNDHSPAHVHLFKGRKTDTNIYDAKINIGNNGQPPKLLTAHPSIKSSDLKIALMLVAEHQADLIERWEKIHGLDNQRRRTRQSDQRS